MTLQFCNKVTTKIPKTESGRTGGESSDYRNVLEDMTNTLLYKVR